MDTLTTIDTAQREYYNRPADERFDNLQALVQHARQEKQLSAEVSYNWRDLRWQATGTERETAGLMLQSPKTAATLTHWSFGQAARMLQSPAAFMRDGLNPQLAADVLNYRITQQPHGEAPTLLVRRPNGSPEPKIRAVTSDSYGRVWDADLYGAILDRFGHKWTNPPTWDGKPAGVYASDRDSFVLQCEGGSIVTDPSLASGSSDGTMYRALMIRNSEVGACSVTIEAVLYRYVCGNHMLWGAIVDRSYRRRHIGKNAVRDTMQEINRIAYAWTNRSASQDEQIIRQLIDLELAHTREAVIDELQAIGFTKQDATAAYDRAEATEKASPRSYWGIAQGITRVSQDQPYQDQRYELDQLAAKVLSRGRKLVAA
jgi:hypothetical protein